MIYDPESGTREFFAYHVPEDVVTRWLSERGQIINQVELHPVAASVKTFRHVIAGRDVIFWIDNESARFGLIRGSSPVPAS